jgi:hypothetical protein
VTEKQIEYRRVKPCQKCGQLKMIDPCVWCLMGAEPLEIQQKKKEKVK